MLVGSSGEIQNIIHIKQLVKQPGSRAFDSQKTNRNDTLRYKNKDKSNTRTPLVVTYHPDLPPLAQIVNKHFSILQTNDKLKQVFPEPPLISYRRPKNLRDLIVRAKLPSDAPEETNVIGSHPCQSSRCKNCKNMTQTSTFIHVISNTTNQTFKIRENITCTTIKLCHLPDRMHFLRHPICGGDK